jgi:hypothetical protein
MVVWRIRRRGAHVARATGAVLGALAASVGLFPLAPLLGLSPHAGRAHVLVELAMRPLGEWDLVLVGAGLHRWLLFASVLPAFLLTAVGFSSRRIRPIIGGIALGTAALLAQMAWAGDAAFAGGAFLLRVWAVGNALLCLWLARTALEASGDGKR